MFSTDKGTKFGIGVDGSENDNDSLAFDDSDCVMDSESKSNVKGECTNESDFNGNDNGVDNWSLTFLIDPDLYFCFLLFF